MLPLYTGKRDIYSFLEFYKNVEKSEGLSQKEINLIKKAYPNHELPAQYVAFLEVAGKHFEPWEGSDYSLVDETYYFDMAEHIKNDEFLEKQFKENGFDYSDSCVFFSHQGYVFAVFKLDGSDNPQVKILDSNYDEDEDKDDEDYEEEICTFADFVIDSYNDCVVIEKYDEGPWFNAFYAKSSFSCIGFGSTYFTRKEQFIVYKAHDVYSINKEKENPYNFLKLLKPILEVCLDGGNLEVFVENSENGFYFYDYRCDYNYWKPDFFNPYKDGTFFIHSTLCWVAHEDKIYIWGERFRKFIEKNSEDFGLVKISSHEAIEDPRKEFPYAEF